MTTTSVLYKTRRVLGDMGETFGAQIPGDGITTIFELPEDKLDQVVAQTQLESGGATTLLSNSVDYVLDGYNGVITLAKPLPQGTLLLVTGLTYQSWPDVDLLDYVTEALALHMATRTPPVVLDSVVGAIPPTLVLPVIEERPVALLAASMVIQDQATDAAKDITIDTGDGTVIPRGQRYNQLIQESARLEQEYQSLVERLGLPGFDTIGVTVMRRVSKTTNRLVPIYVPREWDDRTLPKRVLPDILSGALTADATITYRGLYKLTYNYAINDLVDEGSTRYICTTPNIGIDPITDVAAGDGMGNGLHWSLSFINSGMAGAWYGGGW